MAEIKNIAIIAGYGDLPRDIYNAALKNGEVPTYIGFKSIADFYPTENPEKTASIKLTAIGKIVKFLKQNNVENVIFAGGLKRPSFSSLIPDIEGIKLLARLKKLKKSGDDAIFREIFSYLEEQGFNIVGTKDIAPELILGQGLANKFKPNDAQLNDIEQGIKIAKKIGELDVGQALAIQDGAVLAIEAIDGTDALIKRTKDLHFNGKGAVLIKAKKPNQSDKIDLPTIGEHTITQLKENGFAGVAIEAGESIILNREKTLALADKSKIFVYGA